MITSYEYVFFLALTHATFLTMILLLGNVRKVKKAVVYFLFAEYFAAFTPFTIIALIFEQTTQAVLIIFILHNAVLAVVSILPTWQKTVEN